MTFIPDSFQPPRSYVSSRLTLEVLSPVHAIRDYECVTKSRRAIREVFGHQEGWLSDNWTYAENLADLERHEREFDERQSFAYAIFEHVGGGVEHRSYAGCLYIKPIRPRSEHDWRNTLFEAEAFYWFSVSTSGKQFDKLAADEMMQWISSSWPFASVAFPGRTIGWAEWNAFATVGSQ
jgi:hypothetical protein